MQSASWIDPTLLQVMKARTAVLHRVVRKLRAWPAPNDTQAKKVRFFTLQPVIALEGIRIGKQWVGGEEGGVQRDHGGCEHRRTDCSTSPGSSRETFWRYLRNLRMPHINSCVALIFRAAMYIRYIVYNKHVLILQHFIVEYQQSYQLYSDSSIWKYTVCSIEYSIQHLNLRALRATGVFLYIFNSKKELHLQLQQKWVISKSCSRKHEIKLISL